MDIYYLEQKAWLVCDIIEDFDPYDSFFRLNVYDSKSDIFIGVTLANEWDDYQAINPVEILDMDKNDKLLHSITELFNMVEAETQVIEAQGEADANRVLSESLTPEVIQQHYIETLEQIGEDGNLVVVPEGSQPIVGTTSN